MRLTASLLFPLLASGLSAQLLMNPSFEIGPNGSLSYWQHDCMAQSVAEGAPSSGNWSAEVEASNPQGCFGLGLYQVGGGFDGMTFYLGGWCRNVAGPWAPTIGFDIGIRAPGGSITLMGLGLTTTETGWTWLGTYDTLHLAADEQAVVVCNPGLVGGPGFASARFDAIQYFETFPISIPDQPQLTSQVDIAGGYVAVACMNARITQARLLDSVGRELTSAPSRGSTGTVRLALSGLPPGIYFAAVRTGQGDTAIRFFLP